MKKKTQSKNIHANKIEFHELEHLIRVCEAQRDLCYHLQKFKEATSERLKELEMVKQKAERVMQLKNILKTHKEFWIMTEEEKKKVNALLNQRHIRL